jgi:hypothetical protein
LLPSLLSPELATGLDFREPPTAIMMPIGWQGAGLAALRIAVVEARHIVRAQKSICLRRSSPRPCALVTWYVSCSVHGHPRLRSKGVDGL